MMPDTPAAIAKIEIDSRQLPDPLGANYVGFHRLADDFVLQVGWTNIPEILGHLKKAAPGAEISVVPKVTHQFLMSRTGFAQLYHQVNNFAAKLKKQGIDIPGMMEDDA